MYHFIIFLAISINLPTPLALSVWCRTACHNRISQHQHAAANMAYAIHPNAPLYSWQVGSLYPFQLKCILGIMGDSWLQDKRLHSGMIQETRHAGRRLRMDPHEIELSSNPNETQHEAFIDNYSFGGAKMSTMSRSFNHIDHWANHMPRLTIVHLGACDLSTGPEGKEEHPTTSFQNFTNQFIDDVKSFARNIVSGSKLAEFEAALQQHTWLLIGLPRWGDFDKTERHKRSLNAAQLKKAVKKSNQGLTRIIPSLWKEKRVYFFTPNLEYPEFGTRADGSRDCHLVHSFQEIYNDQILAVAKKLLCSHCRIPNDEFDFIAYEDIKMNPNICKKAQRA